MIVWLVRHAIAEDLGNHADPEADSQRRLTGKGRKQFKSLAAVLSRMNETPNLIISSPLVRAVQTAELLRTELGLRKKHLLTNMTIARGMTAASLCKTLRAAASAETASKKTAAKNAVEKKKTAGKKLQSKPVNGQDTSDLPENQAVIAVVGHEPDLSAVLSRLVGNARCDFPKGCVAAVQIDLDRPYRTGTLLWHVSPAVVTRR